MAFGAALTMPIGLTSQPAYAAQESTSQSSTEVINDISVETQIYQEFLSNDVGWYDRVLVQVKDGIATLTGTTETLRDKKDAAIITSTVRGVHLVRNKINVDTDDQPSGDELADAVDRALLINKATEAYEVGVEANDKGRVTLTGTVQSHAERQLSHDVASTVHGVTQINNELVIEYRENRPRMEMRQEILSKFKFSNLLDAENIDVKMTSGDTVELSGTVPSLAEYNRAVYAAYVSGVQQVNAEKLKVNPNQQRNSDATDVTDQEIKDALELELIFEPKVDSTEVETRVTNGRVQLTGGVESLTAKITAENRAREVTGVRRVDNYLRVTPDKPQSDQAIEKQINESLLTNSVTESFEITPQAKDGVVTLNGTVDSYTEKWEAARVAASINGVLRVKNRIDVEAWDSWVYYNPYVYPDITPGMTDHDESWTTTKTDSEIREDIESELFWSPFVDSHDVTVSVDDGVATLTGSVEDYSERRDATKNAFDGGALAVDNDLLITGR